MQFTRERYRRMIFKIKDIDVEDTWFQHYGNAVCHTSGATLDLLREKIPRHII